MPYKRLPSTTGYCKWIANLFTQMRWVVKALLPFSTSPVYYRKTIFYTAINKWIRIMFYKCILTKWGHEAEHEYNLRCLNVIETRAPSFVLKAHMFMGTWYASSGWRRCPNYAKGALHYLRKFYHRFLLFYLWFFSRAGAYRYYYITSTPFVIIIYNNYHVCTRVYIILLCYIID